MRRLDLQHVEVETKLHPRDLMMIRGVRTHRERQPMAIHNREDLDAFAAVGRHGAVFYWEQSRRDSPGD